MVKQVMVKQVILSILQQISRMVLYQYFEANVGMIKQMDII